MQNNIKRQNVEKAKSSYLISEIDTGIIEIKNVIKWYNIRLDFLLVAEKGCSTMALRMVVCQKETVFTN